MKGAEKGKGKGEGKKGKKGDEGKGAKGGKKGETRSAPGTPRGTRGTTGLNWSGSPYFAGECSFCGVWGHRRSHCWHNPGRVAQLEDAPRDAEGQAIVTAMRLAAQHTDKPWGETRWCGEKVQKIMYDTGAAWSVCPEAWGEGKCPKRIDEKPRARALQTATGELVNSKGVRETALEPANNDDFVMTDEYMCSDKEHPSQVGGGRTEARLGHVARRRE